MVDKPEFLAKIPINEFLKWLLLINLTGKGLEGASHCKTESVSIIFVDTAGGLDSLKTVYLVLR